MKKLVTILSTLFVGLCLLWTSNILPVHASETYGYSNIPTDEEIAAWEADGTLQSRIEFMEKIEETHTSAKLISNLQGESLQNSELPEYWQGGMPSTGNVKALVFMVEFADMKNTDSSIDSEYVSEKFFGTQNTEHMEYPYESLTAYYERSSYNKLHIDGDVYGWYTLSGNRSDYEDDWIGREKLIKELLDAYDSQIDFSDYDSDGDGNVDALYVHYAGGNTGYGTQWWSYMTSTLNRFEYDQSVINKYVFLASCDVRTIIHESGHLLGIPDYYAPDGNNSKNEMGGLGRFDMMDHNIGDHNIFSKMLLGWVEPLFVTQTSEITMDLLSSPDVKAIIVTPENTGNIFDEYYLLELFDNSGNNDISALYSNTKPNFYQTYTVENPLVKIYHVDATLDDEGYKFINDNHSTEHKLIKLLESDGKEMSSWGDYDVVASKLYDKGMSLGPNTMPSSEFYEGKYSGIEILVKDISQNNAVVQINMGVVDNISPYVTNENVEFSSSIAGEMLVGAKSFRLYFDSHIYKDVNYENITFSNLLTGEQYDIEYDIFNTRTEFPESINRYNIFDLYVDGEFEFDTNYVISFPSNAIKDAAGNGNNELNITIKTVPQHKDFIEITNPGWDVLPENTPDGVELQPNIAKNVYYMDNGNSVVLYSLSDNHGGIMVFDSQGVMISNTYCESDINSYNSRKYLAFGEYYLLVGKTGYVILNKNGFVVKQGEYKECGFSRVESTQQMRFEDDYLDIRLYSSECTTSEYGYFIFRIDNTLNVTYLYPNLTNHNLSELNDDYSGPSFKNEPSQIFVFSDNVHDEHTMHSVTAISLVNYGENGINVYNNEFLKSVEYKWTNPRDSRGSLEICDDRDRKLLECNLSYALGLEGNLRALYLGDGYIVYHNSNYSFKPGWTTTYGTQYTRLDENLNILWTTFVPKKTLENISSTPIKIGNKIYIGSGSNYLSLDDDINQTWFSSDKTFNIMQSVGELDNVKQTIKVLPGTKAETIASCVQGIYGEIKFYNAKYEEIKDWTQVIHNGIMSITSANGIYVYYYQITDISEINFIMDSVEVQIGSLEEVEYDFSTANMIPFEEDKYFLYTISDNSSVAIVTFDATKEKRQLEISGKKVGETVITIYNLFGEAVAQIPVKVVAQPQSIRLNEDKLYMSSGETATLTTRIYPLEASNATLVWTSKDETVATVNDKGEVTAVGIGITQVIVRASENVFDECDIVVDGGFDIIKQPESMKVLDGEEFTLEIETVGNDIYCTWEYKHPDSDEWIVCGYDNKKTLYATKEMDGYQYRCVITYKYDAFNVKYSDIATITVDSEFAILEQPSSARVNSGEMAEFSVLAKGRQLRYQWQYKQPDSDEWIDSWHTGMDYSFSAYSENDGYQYRCVITDYYGEVLITDVVHLIVDVELMISSNPQDVEAFETDEISFYIDASGNNINYQWQYKHPESEQWHNYSGEDANTDRITMQASRDKDGYQFRCIVNDNRGAQICSKIATLDVRIILYIQSYPIDMHVYSGETVTFSVEVEGKGLQYQWMRLLPETDEWVECEQGNESTYSVIADETLNGVAYRCCITDKYDDTATTYRAMLYVYKELEILQQPYDILMYDDTDAYLQLYAKGIDLKYEWQYRINESADWLSSDLDGSDTESMLIHANYDMNGYQYRCIITDARGNQIISDVSKLTVLKSRDLYIIVDPSDAYINEGENVEFNVIAEGKDLTYTWQYRTSDNEEWMDTSEVNSNHPEFTILSPDISYNGYQYRCIVSDSYGDSVTSGYATLTIKPVYNEVQIITNPEDQAIIVGDTAVFSVVAEGPNLSYQWQIKRRGSTEWVDSLDDNYHMLYIYGANDFNGYQYRCIVTDDKGNQLISEPAALTVYKELTIINQPNDLYISGDEIGTFEVLAVGKNVTYQWQYYDKWTLRWENELSNSQGNSYTIFYPDISISGNKYRCVITDEFGNELISNIVTLFVGDQEPNFEIVTNPVSQELNLNEYATYVVEATGKDLAYQWQYKYVGAKDWINSTMTGADTNCINVQATKARDGYQYRCMITDANGDVLYSEVATLTLKVDFKITGHPTSKTVEEGSNATFAVLANGSGLTYQWQYRTSASAEWKKSTMAGATTASISVQGTTARNGYQYRCVVKDGNGNQLVSNAATLTVKAPAVVFAITTQPASKEVDLNESATFTVKATGEGLTYQWQYRTSSTAEWKKSSTTGATTASITIQGTAARNGYQYRCVVKDANGKQLVSNAASLTVKAGTSTTFAITTQPASKEVELNENATFTVKATGEGLTYQWQYRTSSTAEWKKSGTTGATTASITIQGTAARNGYEYRCVIKDANGKQLVSNAAGLTVKAGTGTKFAITTQPVNKEVELNANATYTVVATGEGLTYQWQYRTSSTAEWKKSGTTGATTASITIQGTAARNGYEYRCVIKDANGKQLVSNAATLTVKQGSANAFAITSQPANHTVTEGTKVTFSVAATGEGLKYQWQYRTSATAAWKNSGMTGSTTNSITVEATAARNGYQYRCVVFDGTGARIDSNPGSLTVSAGQTTKLAITSQPESKTVALNENATYTVVAEGEGLTYQWQYRTSATAEWKKSGMVGSTTNSITVQGTTARNGYQYRCVVKDASGNQVVSNAADLVVK